MYSIGYILNSVISIFIDEKSNMYTSPRITAEIINIGNTKQEIQYLVNSIEKIAKSNYSDIYYIEKRKHMPMLTPKIIMNPREAYYSEKETIPKEKAIGRISAEVIAECPPGISILLPGELITEEHMPYLNEYKCIEVIKNN